MSARATRPRSRRGRHAPPGELDPVAESSEEIEAASGSSKLSFAPPPVSSGLEQLGPMEEVSGQGLGSRTDKKTDGGSGRGLASAPEVPHKPAVEAYQAPEAALQYKETVPPGIGAPDVFQTLQHALSSLEAAAAAWRHRPPSHPEPMELEDTSKGGPGPLGKQEGAGSSQREAARLAERNAWLRLALSSREDELVRTQASLEAIRAEKETLQKEVQELQNSLLRLEPFPRLSHSQAGGSGSGSSSSEADREPWETQDSFSLAHPLLRRLRSHSSTQILGSLPTQPLSPEMHIMEAQMEQLRGSIEKLKCFNRLLSAVLQGYKGHCEGLSMQLGQREAEATALHLALQYSEHCEEAYRVLLALREANSEAGDEAPTSDLQAAEEEAWRLLAQEEATMDAGARQNPQPSPEGSSVDKPTPQEVAFQLRSYVQRLQERRSLVKILSEPGPTLAPMPTVPRAEAMVQAILGTQSGPALPRLEKTQIQQDLVATREALTDLMLRLQLVRREKRGLELREAALRALGPAHVLLLEQLRWERAELRTGGANSSGGHSSGGGSSGDEEEWYQGLPAVPGGTSGIDGGQVGRAWDPEKLAQELAASLTRTLDLREQLQSLRRELERVAQKGRARRSQSAELNRDLCKAHSALVLALRGAHRKQEEQCRKLEQQMALMEAQQAEEVAVLEATARALGKPRPPLPPPQLGDTVL
ncbi:Usher syndrome type-1C protein-binding protein 1 [Macaca fascicularis]|uniref:Usher syndrome type-1C protein-binding protein 1 n=1 Tax=Macaca fascicularis TaxID=9541 RepID=G7PZR9_MACFA|nr:Usher syndrome type-1C protein-binding protein 1 [Macaca fascicularis]XP_005588415.2 Usher syndrome type-1C protein-binding protein 1 [Macaca fascicularis]XP_015295832.2 Usher syndrome type-1C protein-binding protein 1 [Macaca fascicularis]EHH59339.1 Usher syndrome type-1C protein-binding protein 1 [Macaca fascicularis]